MRASSILATLALAASSVSAFPFLCMSDADATQVATNFQTLITDYSDELAMAALTPDFNDYSSSVGSLINNGTSAPLDLGPSTKTFASRAEFMKGQGSQPSIPFQRLSLWHTCDTVIIRWYSDMDIPVPGIIVMETCPAPPGNKYPYQIKTVFSEFNAAAWLLDLGFTCSAKGAPSTKRSIMA